MRLYEVLNKLKPKHRPIVSVFNKETRKYEDKTVFRRYVSYGISPEFKNTGKSYMFNNKQQQIPKVINRLLLLAKKHDARYNNVVVNWYENGDDFIEPHSDCIDSLYQDSDVMIVNFNEGVFERLFQLKNKFTDEYIAIPLTHKRVIKLNALAQSNYRHWDGRADTTEGRISVTFRAIRT